MLDKDKNRLERLARVHIDGGLPPSVTLVSDLIEFLNKAKTRPGKKIVTILEMMLEIEEMTRPIAPEEPMIAAVEWEKTDPNKYKLHWEIEKRRALHGRPTGELTCVAIIKRISAGNNDRSRPGDCYQQPTGPHHQRRCAPM